MNGPPLPPAQLSRRALALGAAACWGSTALAGASRAGASTPLSLLMPTPDNLQFLAYWLALGHGHFERHGVRPQLVTPTHQRLAIERFTNGAAPLAVLPAPLYFALAGSGVPLKLIANLLSHDPINVVVSAKIAPRLPPLTAPLAERLKALRGLRIGIGHGPVKRLTALLASASLPPDHVMAVTIPGKRQNAAFEAEQVDALYAHTPYLERALVQQGAQLYIRQSAGEVKALTGLLVHALVAAPTYLDQEPERAQAVVTALVQSTTTAGRKPERDIHALQALFPDRPEAELRTIAGLYTPALPASLRPDIEALARTRELFPALHREPLSRKQLDAMIDERFVVTAEAAATRHGGLLGVPLGAMLLGGVAGWMLRRRRRLSEP